jgi:hypothetical protein
MTELLFGMALQEGNSPIVFLILLIYGKRKSFLYAPVDSINYPFFLELIVLFTSFNSLSPPNIESEMAEKKQK